MGLRERLNLRRWRPTRLALDVQDRYSELHGGELASAITLSAFLSLLPLLLVAIAVLGFFSAASSKDLAQQVIDNLSLDKASQTAELITDAIQTAEKSRKAASVLGLAGLLWTGLGVVNALQYAWNTAWQVPGRGLRDKAVGLAWLCGAGLVFSGLLRRLGRFPAAPLVPRADRDPHRAGHRDRAVDVDLPHPPQPPGRLAGPAPRRHRGRDRFRDPEGAGLVRRTAGGGVVVGALRACRRRLRRSGLAAPVRPARRLRRRRRGRRVGKATRHRGAHHRGSRPAGGGPGRARPAPESSATPPNGAGNRSLKAWRSDRSARR